MIPGHLPLLPSDWAKKCGSTPLGSPSLTHPTRGSSGGVQFGNAWFNAMVPFDSNRTGSNGASAQASLTPQFVPRKVLSNVFLSMSSACPPFDVSTTLPD